ncbi:NUDIX hydrolase [Pseudaminobacter arsenicus]|uniref:NUDIX hydrolase n=1 Tax=Borborobacter arsenicus TaxID=1851146 RepID=A0A432UZQ2_9HYPH|nr:NUDIX hydrolase [Pseudaminobacter arsenicus]RUM95427.1 NUDIX hydrolase [Pseudaminobacter arsenicus]
MNRQKAKTLALQGKPLSQVGALPYRMGKGGQLEVLLVTSRKKKRFIFPKGWKMKGKNKKAAAAQETVEEAGVVGNLHRKPIGHYHYRKCFGTVSAPVAVTMFAMRVRRQLSKWPEQEERSRRWVSLKQAEACIDRAGLISFVRAVRRSHLA